MKKYIMPLGILCATLAVIVILVLHNYEIQAVEKEKGPSLTARNNPFLAMERWLDSCGVRIRSRSSASLDSILLSRENTIIIQNTAIDWPPENSGAFIDWIFEGAHVLLILEDFSADSMQEGLSDIFRHYGMHVEENTIMVSPDREGLALDMSISINVLPETLPSLSLPEDSATPSLVGIKAGSGSLTVCGIPYFMMSSGLENPVNAALAWHLTGGNDASQNGILIVRGRRSGPVLFGRIFTTGNMQPLAVSLLFLIIAGLWMTLPSFGHALEGQRDEHVPISRRFLAEARFLSKYRALDLYLAAYSRIIRIRLMKKDRKNHTGTELAERMAELSGTDTHTAERILKAEGPVSIREFSRLSPVIDKILERK